MAHYTPDIFDTAGAAEYLHLSVPTLEKLRLTGNGPRFLKLTPGRRGAVRYRLADLEAWMESKCADSTSQTITCTKITEQDRHL